MATATEGSSEIVARPAADSGRVHSLPTVSQPVRAQAESYSSDSLEGEGGPVEINRPIWAVDLGNEMRALSTFDLWMGLSRGDLSTEVRVWRMGRECWLPAREIPELACALADRLEEEAHAEPTRATLDYEARGPQSGVFASSEARPVDECGTLAETPAPQIIELDPADVITDLPPAVAEIEEPVAHREPRRLVRARRARRNFAASVLGAAVLAASAIAIGQPASEPAPPVSGVADAAHHVVEEAARDLATGRVDGVEPTPAGISEDESFLEGPDLAAAPVAAEDEAPRSVARVKRVSPEKTGQHRRRQK